jgi:threonyl-tRNA synthetase
MSEIHLTFPDGAIRPYPKGITGTEIAGQISKSLLKRTVAMSLDGVVSDLSDPIVGNARIEFVGRDEPRALELIRHDAAHVLAEAVQELFPGTQVTIGPVIEGGFYYDFARNEPFTLDDLPRIEAKMREIVGRNAAFTKQAVSRDAAKAMFQAKGEAYKVELVDAIPAGQDIKLYSQGAWTDLCRGPHMQSTGQVGTAFKLTKVAGAYWRGDSNNAMLSRIYGTAFATQEALDAHLKQIEEAEKRDHRKLGQEMGLFHFQPDAPGSVFWHASGWTLFQTLINFVRRRQAEAGFIEVNTPDMMDKSLWETSGHWQNYRQNMFTTTTEDEREFALKPMNCPGHVAIFKNGLRSYRELPVKIAEFGKVHRYEPSGSLHGLLRVRSFTQDDAHVFCTPEQLKDECLKLNDLILGLYDDFGFAELTIKLATRPENRMGTEEMWDRAEGALQAVLDDVVATSDGRIKAAINPGEGVFYGPKLEYVLRDAIGRDWQVGTVQVDYNLPGRFNAFYIGADSDKHVPIMIHRAMFGSLERFTGVVIEHFGGHFPLWLAPRQIVIATITQEADAYAMDVLAACRAAGLRAEVDLRNEKINYKVREHSLHKVPVMLVVGKREAETHGVNIRRLGSQAQTEMTLAMALSQLGDEALPPDLKRIKAARQAAA